MVNGAEVMCSTADELSIRAEWAANDPALKIPEKARISDGDLADLLVRKGLLTDLDVSAAVEEVALRL